jgi:putative ABC transport system permease protein
MLGRSFDFLLRRRRFEDELDEELRSNFEILVDRYVAGGMTEAEARRAARLDFEGVEVVKEKVRDGAVGAAFAGFLQDARYAWRAMRRRPSFTAVAALTLALGIGANAAVFSAFYAVLLRPLPYDNPERLVLLWASFRSAGNARAPVSGTILREVGIRNRSLAGVAGIWTATRTFTGDEPEQVKCARVTANFFDLVGVRAAAGHTFTPLESGTPAIVLANGIFHRRFGGNPATLGKAVPMQGRAGILAGVLPADFQLFFAPDANVPGDVQVFDTFGPGVYLGRKEYYIRLVGRLKPGVRLADAQADLDRVGGEIRGAYADYAAEDLRFTVAGMHADAVRDVKPALAVLFAGSAFVLLICCVNVASLLLSRASERRKEIALRLALGASRGRILRQLLAEGFALAALGGATGAAVGWGGFRLLLAIRPERLARIGGAGVNWTVAVAAAVAAPGAAILLGIAPALESFRVDLIETLRTSGRGWMGRLQRRAGAALVVAEIALGFVLVTGAVLAARTLARVEQAAPGFEARHLLAFQIAGAVDGPPSAMRDWEAQLAALPGVERVGATSHLPLDTDIPNWYGAFRPEGVSEQDAAALVSDLRCVTAGYFSAMGTRLLEGRFFNSDDRAGTQPVAIVDEMLARSTWPGQSAIGKKLDAEHVTQKGFVPVASVVVGVVEHVHNQSLTRRVRGSIYMPFEQSPRSPLTFVVRSTGDPLALVPAVREALRRRTRTAALAKVRPMTQYVAREIAPVSFTAILAAVFGALALLLAATGIYGVLRYQVSQRLPEMGIRMALGARASDVLRLIAGEALWLATIGVALGAAGALAAGRWIGALVYGVGPRDPLSLAAALVLLPAAAMLGAWRPAARAASATPAEVIREE